MPLSQSHHFDTELELKDWLDGLHEYTMLGGLVDGEREKGDSFFLVKFEGQWRGSDVSMELGECTSAELAHVVATSEHDLNLEILALPPQVFESEQVVVTLASHVHRGAHLDGEPCTDPEHRPLALRGAQHLLRLILQTAVGTNVERT